MKYEQQVQTALDRLDQSLARLNGYIKRNENQLAIQFMDDELKERFMELQSMITIASTNQLGAAGTVSMGTL